MPSDSVVDKTGISRTSDLRRKQESKTGKGGKGLNKRNTAKRGADTATNENTTEADLVLNQDLNSTNDI